MQRGYGQAERNRLKSDSFCNQSAKSESIGTVVLMIRAGQNSVLELIRIVSRV